MRKETSFGKWICIIKYLCSIVLIMAIVMTMLPGTAVYASETVEAISENLLVNPDWADGLEGWEILADSQKEDLGDHEVLCSAVYQDVPVEESMKGKSVKLSGNIAIAPEDPTQESLRLSLYMCGADESFLQEETVSEESTQLVYHEIIMDVPEDAAFIRVSMEIRKQGYDNNFNFGDFRLEIVENNKSTGNPFVRHIDTQPADDSGQLATSVETPPDPPTPPQTEPRTETSDTNRSSLVTDNGDGTYTIPNLFIPDDAAYFNGHYYYYYDDIEATWSEANAICFSSGGKLVTITSAEEQAFIENQFPGTQGWIGAYLEDGVWKWFGGEPFEYTNWKEGEPNNSGGNEEYAHLYTLMKWNDLPDDDTSYHRGFYCEWESDTVSYFYNGRFDGKINEESRRLTEEGKAYYYGTDSTACDYEKAFKCFQDALGEDESAEAWFYFGLLLLDDLKEFSSPYTRAFGSFERAIDFGCHIGWPAIGMMFLEGKMFDIDYDKAAQFFQIGLELGYTDANLGFGYLYSNGRAMEPDYSKALEFFEKAAGGTYWEKTAMYQAGKLYADGHITGEPDYAKAYEWWMKGAQEGGMLCCTALAWLYENGYGVEQSFSEAMHWYERAAWHGSDVGNYNMGQIYSRDYDEYGVEQDYAKAFSYFLRSAELGMPEGMTETGDCYYYGDGTELDLTAAFDWYLKAANKNNTYGMYSLGYMYEFGIGTSKDLSQARQWYERILDHQDEAEDWVVNEAQIGIARIDSGESAAQDNNSFEMNPNLGYDTSADYGYDYDNYQSETQPWEDPYFIGYTQDGVPQYSYDTYEYQTQPWEDPYFIGYTQDGVPQYSYDTYEYETQPWESPYFIGYTQDGVPQYSYD